MAIKQIEALGQISIGLKFSPRALQLIRDCRFDLQMIRQALQDHPEGQAAYYRILHRVQNSPDQFFQFFQETEDQITLELYQQYLAWNQRRAAAEAG